MRNDESGADERARDPAGVRPDEKGTYASFEWMLDQLKACDASLDLIVLPEFSDVPGRVPYGAPFHSVVSNFYNSYDAIAKVRPDVVIGCSLQRSDRLDALEIINQFCAYNTAAYLVRASVSMGLDSKVGGSSMVVAPTGEFLEWGIDTILTNDYQPIADATGLR